MGKFRENFKGGEAAVGILEVTLAFFVMLSKVKVCCSLKLSLGGELP